jgi:organic radical activating enzyme
MSVLTYLNPEKLNWYLISWTLGNKCNYRCTYCPTFLHDGTAGWPNWNEVRDFVLGFNLPGKEICYRISGGEPTYWKHFPQLAELIKQQGHTFSYLTNGSQTVEYYQKLSQYTDGMILSWHPQYANLEHFVNILQNVSGLKAVNIMFTPENFDDVTQIAKTLYNASSTVTIWPKIVLDKADGSFSNEPAKFSEEQQVQLKSWPYLRDLKDQKLHRGKMILDGKEISANDLIITGKNNHLGWKCWGGLDGMAIDQHGNIYRTDCSYGGAIGNLSNYTLPTDPIICGKTKCSCLSDVYLRKSNE